MERKQQESGSRLLGLEQLPNELLLEIMWNLDFHSLSQLARIKPLHKLATQILYRKDVICAQDPPLTLSPGTERALIKELLPPLKENHHWGAKALAWGVWHDDVALINRSLAHDAQKVVDYKTLVIKNDKWLGTATPLHIAAMEGLTDLVNHLITHGADVESLAMHLDFDFGDEFKRVTTPLGMALDRNQDMTAVSIIRKGAGLDVSWEEEKDPQRLAYTALMAAVKGENIAALTELLEIQHVNVNATNARGVTALHLATQVYNECEIMPRLLAAGADAQAIDANGETPLHWCCINRMDHVREYIRLLIDANADVNVQNASGETPLGSAAWQRNFRAMECFISSHQADLNLGSQTQSDPWALLTEGYTEDDLPIFDETCASLLTLIKAGIVVDDAKIAAFLEKNCYAIPSFLWQHLHEPIEVERWISSYEELSSRTWMSNKSIRFLLEFYPPPPPEAYGSNTSNWQRIFKNIYRGEAICDPDISQLLAQHAKSTGIGPDGKQLVTWLLGSRWYDHGKHLQLLEQLFALGVDPMAKDIYQRNWIHLLATNRRIGSESFQSTLTLLINYGIDLNAPDNDGDTALHIIVRNGRLEAADLEKANTLIGSGANLDLETTNGHTPLQSFNRTSRKSFGIDLKVATLLNLASCRTPPGPSTQ
ncbi:Serine/threonine-protein phosphatase 6 regulatory ankyrin repeat subunit C [Paramyrothecium foliicola]|nr:Serine/threonine-protein phosphatase 6 regulatory ankyrin repeat subunit C [Paramyrothecium foliicola]